MSRDEVRAELAQTRAALAEAADQLAQTPGRAGAAGDPLGALYFAVHHLYRAVEKLVADDQKGA